MMYHFRIWVLVGAALVVPAAAHARGDTYHHAEFVLQASFGTLFSRENPSR
jgi:hypothetical protein